VDKLKKTNSKTKELNVSKKDLAKTISKDDLKLPNHRQRFENLLDDALLETKKSKK